MRDWLEDYEQRDWQQATEGTIRYALIGLGWWTMDVALPAIEDSAFGEVTVLVSSTTQKAETLATDHDVPVGISYDEFHDGTATDQYDAVYIGTPNAYHLKYAASAADHGKAVLCEKPMEKSVDRAERLVDVCEDADVPLMVAYRMQTDPTVRRARELVADGAIGTPIVAHGQHTQPLLQMNPDPEQWRLNPDASGYGTSVMDLGIYSINTTRFLLGCDPVMVQSQMASTHEAFADVPDQHAASIVTFDGDVHLVCTSSQHANTHTFLSITGTEGTLELRPAFQGECQLHVSRGDQTIEVTHETFDAQREMREEFDYFADRLLTGTSIGPDGEHGLLDMRTIRAIHEAAESDTAVDI